MAVEKTPEMGSIEEILHKSDFEHEFQLADGDLLDHPIQIVYSSGTTGMPQAIYQTNRNMLANNLWFAEGQVILEQDTSLCSTPLCHMMGSLKFVRSLIVGSKMVITPMFDRNKFAEIAIKYNIDVLFAVSSLITQLANVEIDDETLKKIHFKDIRIGGEPAQDSIVKKFLSRYKVDSLRLCYGSSECGMCLTSKRGRYLILLCYLYMYYCMYLA